MGITIKREVDVSTTVDVDTTAEVEIEVDDLLEELGIFNGLIVNPGDAKAPPPGLIDDMLRAARRYDRVQFDQLASELYRSATV